MLADLEINLETGTVSRDGGVIDLPDLSWRLLRELVNAAPHLVGKDQLIERVWEGVVVSDETLAQRVKLLRQALADGKGKDRYIVSVRNRGYRIAPEPQPVGTTLAMTGSHARWWVWPLAVALLLIFTWLNVDDDQQPPSARNPSVAVLPFEDLSNEAGNAYFVDGLHEELLGKLTRIGQMDVVSRTSVLPYRNTGLTAPEIATRLGADILIEGSVRRSGGLLRLSVQVIDGESDRHLWAESFERRLTVENIFAIQVEVAEAVAQAVKLSLSGDQRSRLVSLPTDSIEAYDLYLLGRYSVFQLTRDSIANGIEWLSRAVELDPGFAEAWATLGWAFSFQGTDYGDAQPRIAYEKAREAALRALALDPGLSDAHSLYADILTWYDWDWAAAEREYLATLELDPYNVLGYSLFLSTQGRHDEAVGLIEKLLQRFPGNDYYHLNAAWRYLNARDYASAIGQARLSAGHPDSGLVLGWALMSSGEIGQALEIFQREFDADPDDPSQISDLAIARLRNGEESKAKQLLDQLLMLSKQRHVSPVTLAAVYFEMGESGRAFELLNEALEYRSRGLIFLQVDHVYDAYRDDPRYEEIRARLEFP